MAEEGVLSSIYPDDELPEGDIYSIIKQNASGAMERNAVMDIDTLETLTYSELYRKSDLVARHLLKLGFSKENTLVFYCHNCIEVIIFELAVLRLGGRFASVASWFTTSELTNLIDLCDGDFIFTTDQLANKVLNIVAAGTDIKCVICREEVVGCISYQSLMTEVDGLPKLPDRSTINIQDDDVIAIHFSSGTTGPPKAVLSTQKSLLRGASICWLVEPTAIMYLPMSSHISTHINLSQLMKCRQFTFMREFDLKQYIEAVATHKIESLFLATSLIVLLHKTDILEEYDLSHVKYIFNAGAKLSGELEEQICKKMDIPTNRFFPCFGMTEAGGLTGMRRNHVGVSRPPGSCGLLLPGTQAKVVDIETGKPLGHDKEGEILVKGKQVMAGYYKNPEATREAIDKDEWLHSGDIGHYNKDGYFFITDRKKEIFKCHGKQVSPSELDTIILKIPDVADCGVFGMPDQTGGEVPYACVVLNPGGNITEKDIKDFVAGHVAYYKQLNEVKFVDKIPKNTTGKILRYVMQDNWSMY